MGISAKCADLSYSGVTAALISHAPGLAKDRTPVGTRLAHSKAGLSMAVKLFGSHF